MKKQNLLILCAALFLTFGYWVGTRKAIVHAQDQAQGSVPKSYGKLVAAIPDEIGTGLVFESSDGVIRFVSVTGMKEGELARYDKTPTHGGIPPVLRALGGRGRKQRIHCSGVRGQRRHDSISDHYRESRERADEGVTAEKFTAAAYRE